MSRLDIPQGWEGLIAFGKRKPESYRMANMTRKVLEEGRYGSIIFALPRHGRRSTGQPFGFWHIDDARQSIHSCVRHSAANGIGPHDHHF